MIKKTYYYNTNIEAITIELPDGATDIQFELVLNAHRLSVVVDNIVTEIIEDTNSDQIITIPE